VTDDQISQSLFYAVVFQSIDKWVRADVHIRHEHREKVADKQLARRCRDVHNEKVDSVFLITVALPISDFIMTMF